QVDLVQQLKPEERKQLRQAGVLQRQALQSHSQGKTRQAVEPARRALRIRRELLGDDHYETGLSYGYLGTLLLALGEQRQAQEELEKAVATARKNLGDSSDYLAPLLNSLAETMRLQGNYIDARPNYDQALKIARRLHGSTHATTRSILTNLGLLH